MKKIIILIVLLVIPLIGFSQTDSNAGSSTLNLNLNKGTSSFTIKGTSSLHDWEMVSEKFNGSLKYINNGNSLSVENIQIQVSVKNLVSGKKIMDNKCHDALKADKHPNITYHFKNIGSLKPTGTNTYNAVITGDLSIAGVTKSVPVNVVITQSETNFNIKGEKALKMTDFGVTPPTALLGTLKTGDDITIDFNLNYN